MTVATNTVLRVVASFLWADGEINQNVFNAILSGGGGPWDDQEIVDDAEAWLDNMYLNLVTHQHEDMPGNEVIVYKYDVAGADWDEVGSQAWTYTPTNVTEQMPRGVSPLVRLWTIDPDVQGRKYISGVTEGGISDGTLGAGTLVDLLAFAADWYTPFVGGTSGATWTPGIWSVVRSVFLAGVDHIAATAILAYQRRRKRGVGI